MKSDKKILKSASVVAGALLTTSLAAAPSLGADLLAYNDLGSGAQVRSHLIDVNANQAKAAEATAYKFGELKCGEGKCGDDKKADAKKGAKAEGTKAAATTADSKTAEAKCGEGKCGEGKCGGDSKEAKSYHFIDGFNDKVSKKK